MKRNGFQKFLGLLTRLEAAHIPYTLDHYRDEAVMVSAQVPGERWEIEFLEDGTIEIEKFLSDGAIYDERALSELFHRYEEPETEVFESSLYTESRATVLQMSTVREDTTPKA